MNGAAAPETKIRRTTMTQHAHTSELAAAPPGKAPEAPVTLWHHPDTLYDEEYEPVVLQPDCYRSLTGHVQVAERDRRGITLRYSGGGLIRLDAWGGGILRIRASRQASAPPVAATSELGLVSDGGEGEPFRVVESERGVSFLTPTLTYALDAESGDFEVKTAGGTALLRSRRGGLRFSDEPASFGGERSLGFFDIADETFFGFGGRIAHPCRNRTSADIFSVKAGTRRGDYGGFPIPFFLSTRGYGVFLNNPWPHTYFDMGQSSQDEWFFQMPGGTCELFVFYGPEFSDIVQRYATVTGRPPLPPKWAFGFWCSSLSFETADQVINVARRLRKEHWPCDTIVLDGPWRGGPDFIPHYRKFHVYLTNDIDWHEDFGDGPSMVRTLESMGFKVVLHLNSRNYKPETAEAGIRRGLLRRHNDEVVVRVTDPAAEDYFERLITPRIEERTAGWWTDHADRVSGEISPGLPSRNLFGNLWNRLLVDITRRHGGRSAPVLTRGGGIGGQRYGIPWPGDTRSGIDAYEEDVWFCLNAGLAGYAFSSVDGGGFTPPSDYDLEDEERAYQEVFNIENVCRRLCQSLFFVPVPRIHNSARSIPKLPWNCPEAARELYKDFLRLRYRFTPYIWSYAIHSAETGEPITRPLVYHYRQDAAVYNIGDELLLGEWLLVAPVTTPGTRSRRVYLPAGRWIDFWSRKSHDGGQWVDVDTPMFSTAGLPIFVKAGAILATQPVQDHLENAPPNPLSLDIYPQGLSRVNLRESADVTTSVTCREETGRITVTATNPTPSERLYGITLHGRDLQGAALPDGAVVESEQIFAQYDHGGLRVSVPVSPGAQQTVVFTTA